MNNLILNIKILRYFKRDNKKYGDFFVETTEGNYFIFVNADEITIFSHLLEKKSKECLSYPTEKFKEEFLKKIEDKNETDR